MDKEPKQKYIICFDYVTEYVVREFITKPMTEEDFETDIRGCVREELFPILIEGNRREALENYKGVWDNLIYTKAMHEDSNLFITMGVWHG